MDAGDPSGGGCWGWIAGLTASAVALAALGAYVATHPGGGQRPAAPTGSPHASASAGPCPFGAGSVDFQDPGYADADWTDGQPAASTLSTATFDVTRRGVGSGPDQRGYRATHLVFAGRGVLVVLHLQRAAVYDPARCGPISALDASFSVQDLGAAGPAPVPAEPLARAQSVGLAIRQGGVVYWTSRHNLVAAASAWTPVVAVGLEPQDFFDYLQLEGGRPDFTAGPVELGYITISRCAVGMNDPPCGREETTSALGAWHVTVHR